MPKQPVIHCQNRLKRAFGVGRRQERKRMSGLKLQALEHQPAVAPRQPSNSGFTAVPRRGIRPKAKRVSTARNGIWLGMRTRRVRLQLARRIDRSDPRQH
jgi:hypothetical protein